MSEAFKPMLASPADVDKIRWPMYASVKLDGIRAVVRNGMLLSRSLKHIPNFEIAAALSKPAFEGLDGELIVGPTTSPTCYRDTVSGVMSEDTSPDWTFHAFDLYRHGHTFQQRYDALMEGHTANKGRIQILPQTLVHDIEALNTFEAAALELGHEGVILRHPDSPYKFGRSTAREGYLLKVKRFVDSEATVQEVIEEMHNGNVAETNELGRTKRSSHQENKTGKGRMGALLVRDVKTGVEFQIGTGFDDSDKAWWWSKHQDRLQSGGWHHMVVKYKHFPIGVKDKPRHPVYLGLRDARDMS
jgi:DNA ligase 1